MHPHLGHLSVNGWPLLIFGKGAGSAVQRIRKSTGWPPDAHSSYAPDGSGGTKRQLPAADPREYHPNGGARKYTEQAALGQGNVTG
jgi:hypothetical protein